LGVRNWELGIRKWGLEIMNLQLEVRKWKFEKPPVPSHQSLFQQCKSTSEIGINPKMFK